jgi:hypothetical protein
MEESVKAARSPFSQLAATDDTRVCSRCNKKQDRVNFAGKGGCETKQCGSCRAKNRARAKSNQSRQSAQKKLRYAADATFRDRVKKTQTKYRNAHPENEQSRHDSGRKSLASYKQNARIRGVGWSLTDEQVWHFFKQPCFYCDKHAAPFNGIDRYDNSIGYTFDNCVPCCTACNMSKGEWSAPTFVSFSGHIASTAGHVGGPLVHNLFPNSAADRDLFKPYKLRAEKSGISFELSPDEFCEIVTKPCDYCGRVPTDAHRNGIDRTDNAPVYAVDQVIPCCYTCNLLKHTITKKAFLERCLAVWTNCKDKIEIATTAEKQKRKKMKVATE